MPLFYTDVIQVRNKCVVHWFRPEYDNKYFRSKRIHLYRNFNNSKTYTGMITASTAKRIRLTVDLLLQISKARKVTNPFTQKVITHRLSFITLTIAYNKRRITPMEGHKKILKPFLRYMREKDLINTYIWKAEFQQKEDYNGDIKESGGQLHYHITTPSVIDWRIIRKYWNGLLIKNNLLNEYFNEYGHYDPNSTDIHQVHKIRDIQAYLVKYLSKASQNQEETKGKIWDCSDNLKGKKHMNFDMNQHNIKRIVKLADTDKVQIKQLENCAIIKGKSFNPTDLLDQNQRNDYNNYLLSIRDKDKSHTLR